MMKENTKNYRNDHISLTVPNLDEATQFFEKVFQADVVVDGLKETDEPWHSL